MEQPADPTLAEWWQRLVARIIDNLIVSLIASPVYVFYFIWLFSRMTEAIDHSMQNPQSPPPMIFSPLEILVWSVGIGAAVNLIGFFYDWLCHAKWGATPGKRMMSIKVVRDGDREKITSGMAAKRALAYPLAGIVPLVGSLYILIDVLWQFSDKATRHCLHDRFAGTLVIRTDPPRPRPMYGPPPGHPQHPGHPPQPGYGPPPAPPGPGAPQ